MKNGSAPGPDGIPVEFFKTFWPDVKFLFMNSLHYSHTVGMLSPTQSQGTISLIHKGKDLVKDKLTNWRPISLTNADYKIKFKGTGATERTTQNHQPKSGGFREREENVGTHT